MTGIPTIQITDLTEEYLYSALMDQTIDYMRRGRRLERLATPELDEQWVVAFQHYVRKAVRALRHKKSIQKRDTLDMDDAGAELRLRGRDIPVESAMCEAAVLDKLMEVTGWPDAPELDRQIDRYVASRRMSMN